MIRAKDFAIAAHGDQKYDDKPYEYHLQKVVDILEDWGYTEDHANILVSAAWLHDVLEDTDTTVTDLIEAGFHSYTILIVENCTGRGENRSERQHDITAKCKNNLSSCIVKAADRIANIEYCTPGSRIANLYLAESLDFNYTILSTIYRSDHFREKNPAPWIRMEYALNRLRNAT